MKICNLNHIAINTKDLDKSMDFYTNILKFKRIKRVDYDGYCITYVNFNGGNMEIFNYKNPSKAIERDEADIGLRHIAFEVDDVCMWEESLKEHNVPICLPVTELPELGMKVLLCYDPDGITVELCEKL